MITRIVKMHFSANYIEDFKSLFSATRGKIAAAEGCIDVQLFQDETNPSLFFTISKWESTADLEKYRNSELFIATWSQVKPNFLSKAEAYSLVASH
jgi:quinol monooxygenase YgiN